MMIVILILTMIDANNAMVDMIKYERNTFFQILLQKLHQGDESFSRS